MSCCAGRAPLILRVSRRSIEQAAPGAFAGDSSLTARTISARSTASFAGKCVLARNLRKQNYGISDVEPASPALCSNASAHPQIAAATRAFLCFGLTRPRRQRTIASLYGCSEQWIASMLGEIVERLKQAKLLESDYPALVGALSRVVTGALRPRLSPVDIPAARVDRPFGNWRRVPEGADGDGD